MPVTIRELVIKTTVSSQDAQAAPAQSAGSGAKDIVQECVDQVLEILGNPDER